MSAATAPVAPGAVPASVQAEGPQAVKGYEAALGFEQLLVSKLLSEALPEAGEGGEGEASEPRAASLAESFAGAITSAGGLGVAAELYGSQKR